MKQMEQIVLDQVVKRLPKVGDKGTLLDYDVKTRIPKRKEEKNELFIDDEEPYKKQKVEEEGYQEEELTSSQYAIPRRTEKKGLVDYASDSD
jgi:hypothetical protein